MGHVVNPQRHYARLQQRLDRHLTGAPDSPVFQRILRLLFSPEDAALACRLPLRLTPVETLARSLAMEPEALDERTAEMARSGLVLDLVVDGRRYVSLAPVVIGFFEFTFMRTRDDLPMGELAGLFESYMREDDRFARSLFRGQTQIGRALVHEESLPEEDATEVLDWERASRVVESARALAVSLCACRHKALHAGKACERPLRNCLSLDHGAEVLVRNGLAEPISTAEAMGILETAKAAGLAQTGDNVQRHLSFICNCCGCCCGLFGAIRDFDIRGAVVSSNWIAAINPERCRGCGRCVKACPVGALASGGGRETGDRRPETGDGRPATGDGLDAPVAAPLPSPVSRPPSRAGDGLDAPVVAPSPSPVSRPPSLTEGLCLGCGVCYSACRQGAISLRPRARRVFTPESTVERTLAMAIERGKLAELIFGDPERLSTRALAQIVRALERVSPLKLAMAAAPLRSLFLGTLVRAARQKGGQLTKVVE